MITKTSEDILTPLAETVSQLIIYVEESNRTGSPLPDLTGVSSGVAGSVVNLVKAGRDIAAKEPAGSPRGQRMLAACDQLEKSSDLLNKTAANLKANSFEKKFKVDLMEAVRMLLAGKYNFIHRPFVHIISFALSICRHTKYLGYKR